MVSERKSITRAKFATGRVNVKRDVLTFTLPVAYFARVIDFRSYVDATLSLYSIIYDVMYSYHKYLFKVTRRYFHLYCIIEHRSGTQDCVPCRVM